MTRSPSLPFTLPRDSVWPDYGAGGLFGLVSAVGQWLRTDAWTDRPWPVAGMPAPRGSVLVFLLVDGLGDTFLRRHGGGSALLAHRRGRLTSVFPSTTASAVTTVLTGLAPVTHGLTGWFIHDRRFGGVLAPLPLVRRAAGPVRGAFRLQRLFPYDTLYRRGRKPAIMVSPESLADSPYSMRHARGARIVPYRGLARMVDAIAEGVAALAAAGGGYLHAYYAAFDAKSHHYGVESARVLEEFARIDAAFATLVDRLSGSGTELLVSADHGFIDAPDERRIALHHRPEVAAMLAAPLCGERRTAWCEVRGGAAAEFEAFAREELAGRAVLVPSAQAVGAGLLGGGPRHRRLRERVGTHGLLMEPGWTVCDRLPGERLPRMIGVHGGLSSEEMWIPLIHARC